MTEWHKILPFGVILFFFVALSSSASAKTAGYCLECHSQRLKPDPPIPIENRSVYQIKIHPCPGIRSLSEEFFFTENRIVKLDQILNTLKQEGRTNERMRKRVSEISESLSDLKDSDTSSISKLSKEASSLRASLQKVHDRTLQVRDEFDRRWLIGVGSLIFLGLLLLFGIGYRKLGRMGRDLLLIFIIGGTFSSSSCSFGAVEPEKKSSGQERLERSLTVASQTTSQMEETFYQSFLLAEMAKEWSKIEPASAEKAFELAWQMALSARKKVSQIDALQDVAYQWPDQAKASKERVIFDMVLDLRDEIRNADGRTWALRAIAEEWVQANEKKGRIFLESASREALGIKDTEFRDRDLKSISEAWLKVDENRSLEIARSIGDPFLRALALTDVALFSRNKNKATNILQEAWKTAEFISPPYSQVKAFIQISATAARIFPKEKKTWGERAFAQIQGLKNPQLQASIIQEMIFKWAHLDAEQAEHLAAGISPLFPESRAYSLIHMAGNREIPKTKAIALLKRALAETSMISDPFESQKIKTLVVKGLVRLEPDEALRILPQIEDPFYGSTILEELANQFSKKDKKKALDLAERIPLEDFRKKTIVEIIHQWMDQDREQVASLYREMFQGIPSISDPYVRGLNLIELGKSWGRLEKGKEADSFDLALKSAGEISSLYLKTEILEALAEAWKHFDKEKAHPILEKMDPSVNRARKYLEEIRLWAKADPLKALQWAETFPSAFPLEKAKAIKDAAIEMKKTEPGMVFHLLEKTLSQVLALPEGSERNKLLPRLITEMALLSKEGTLQRLRQIDDWETRGRLLREAGNTWIKVDPVWAVRAAGEISESALRFGLYRKIAEGESRKRPLSNQSVLMALSQWGIGREKAKKNESHAIRHYEKALREVEKLTDPQDRSYLLSGLASEWAPIDEEKVLQVVHRISFPEPLSYALLQIGAQLRKWNRKEAEAAFQKTYAVASQIKDPSLRAKRFLQLGQEWQVIDKSKGKEVLKAAESELEKRSLSTKDEKILGEILLAQANLELTGVLSMTRSIRSPLLRAKILLESAKILSQLNIEENVKALDRAFQFAQGSKNYRLIGRIAVAWSLLDTDKGLELLSQVDSKEIRFKSLRQMAHHSIQKKKEARKLLQKATEEAMRMDDLKEKTKALKEIAVDWTSIDREEAKAVYQMAYQSLQKAAFYGI